MLWSRDTLPSPQLHHMQGLSFRISQFFITEHDICWKCFSSLMSFSVSSYHHWDSMPYHCPIGTPKLTVDLFTAPPRLREKSIIKAGTQEAVLNLWVKTPLGVERLFHSGRLKPSENTDVYVTIHNRAKLQLLSTNENNFIIGCHQNTRNRIKGSQHEEGYKPLEKM